MSKQAKPSVLVPAPSGSRDGLNIFRTEILDRCERVAQQEASRARQMYGPSFQKDDFIQDAWVGIIEAIGSYDPDHGVPFEQWAHIKARAAIAEGIRQLDTRRLSLPVDAPQVTSPNLIEIAWECLDEEEYWTVYYLYMEGMRLDETAVLMDVSPNRIKWVRQEALRKLREAHA
jgi:RNA polymerase sigma factor (sigma-70 family)